MRYIRITKLMSTITHRKQKPYSNMLQHTMRHIVLVIHNIRGGDILQMWRRASISLFHYFRFPLLVVRRLLRRHCEGVDYHYSILLSPQFCFLITIFWDISYFAVMKNSLNISFISLLAVFISFSSDDTRLTIALFAFCFIFLFAALQPSGLSPPPTPSFPTSSVSGLDLFEDPDPDLGGSHSARHLADPWASHTNAPTQTFWMYAQCIIYGPLVWCSHRSTHCDYYVPLQA